MPQSEVQLENTLIDQLQTLGFERTTFVKDPDSLQQNLKNQLEKLNETTFSDEEFERILNHLHKGNSFQKSKQLRDRFLLEREGNSNIYVKFFNMDEWCKNFYQVANQIKQRGKYENRYDVTLLINGLPLVQIELKKRGIEMKEAFNQVKRYQKHSFADTLFDYLQIFVISNGINTKYFANNPSQGYEQTFTWTDAENNKINTLEEFAESFLEKCHISQMIGEFIVLAEAYQVPMILRPYQYYAVKAIENQVKNTNKNGYIWHTTGSGKTLTSFKTSQILVRTPDVKKVLFVVDRKDLDVQTVKEFNSFAPDSVDDTNETKTLVNQLEDPTHNLIVTTIQKLDKAVKSSRYAEKFAYLQDEKVVIIFDECHRSQFGGTNARIRNFFKNSQMFGFTGTPIFANNHIDKVTTADIFGQCLHSYVITDAINDNNVLGFTVEYVGRYKHKKPRHIQENFVVEEKVSGIDKKEILESNERISKITDYILQDWYTKTKNGQFNAILATPSTDVLKKYYQQFREKKPEDFNIATIFTYKANEDEQRDMLDMDVFVDSKDAIDQHSRDFLEDCIKDYNQQFGTNYSTEHFYQYYKDVQKRTKNREINLVIVVNMLLTGFDSKLLNTLYVDKNLRHHGLIQAYSRTNRLCGPKKPHGNIVCFRNLKENTDKALSLFGNPNAKEIVFKEPYEEQQQRFNEQVAELQNFVSTPEDVDELKGEEEKAQFVQLFKKLLRTKSSLETFAEFTFNDLDISEDEFNNYLSKYSDLYEERQTNEGDKASVLQEIDFELELIGRNEINFDYIVGLLAEIRDANGEEAKQRKKEGVLNIMDRDLNLRKKKELIREFIEENLPKISKNTDLEEVFSQFWNEKRKQALQDLAEEHSLDSEQLQEKIHYYLNTDKMPKRSEMMEMRTEKAPSLLARSKIVQKITNSIRDFVERFEW